MANTFGTHNSFESTVAMLRAELPRLEERRRTLEQELAAVTECLEYARSALSGLEALSAAPLLQEPDAAVAPAEQAPEAAGPAARPAKRSAARSTPQAAAAAAATSAPAPAKARAVRKAAAGKTASAKAATVSGKTRGPAAGTAKSGKAAAAAKPVTAKAAPAVAKAEPKKRTSGLADGILAYLAGADTPARAGYIAQALGREATPGSVNAVRTALERLVKASKAQRSGRGLYQALPR